MMTIVDEIRALLEDKPMIVTDELVKTYIEGNIDILIEEIKEEL